MRRLSLRPPLSPEIRERVNKIVSELIDLRGGESTVYTGCIANCGGLGQCVLKAHVRNGKVTVIEPDDRYNRGVGREDTVLSCADLVKTRIQRRGCPMAWIWHRHFSNPDRVVYPLKRISGSKRGEAKFRRITWDEALDTIADKLIEVKKKYGPYSIMNPYHRCGLFDAFMGFMEAGVETWGQCSRDPERLAQHLMIGEPAYSDSGSSSAADEMLNAELIILWGFDPTVTHHGPGHAHCWYLRMARERGTPIICIEPRYSAAAETLADQFIPIKPGTDAAMLLAVADILIREELYDKRFVSERVYGFDKWKEYIIGKVDGVEKTPEWASYICGVPARTITAFAHIYAKNKPSLLWLNWSVCRKSFGENTTRAAAGLQAMMGYFGQPGGHLVFYPGSWPIPRGHLRFISEKPKYVPPAICRGHYWAQAVLLLDKVRSGEMSDEEWRRLVGYRAPSYLPIPAKFEPKVALFGKNWAHSCNSLVTVCESANDQIRALEKFELIVYLNSMMTPTAKYADIILPVEDPMWESMSIVPSEYGGFSFVTYCPGVVKPTGDVKSHIWIYTKLAERLGFAKRFNQYYTTDENWDKDWEQCLKDKYHTYYDYLRDKGLSPPSWEEFISGYFLNVDELHDKPYVGWEEEAQGRKHFKTKSGKFEVYSDLISDVKLKEEGEHTDSFGRIIDNLPGDWQDLQPYAVYQCCVRGLEDPLRKQYPLMLLTSHSRYRVHSLFWTVPWLRGDVYRHAIWLNLADAKARGVKDGDYVKVFNDRGELVLPVYVTSRIMPSVALIHQGAWYEPDDNGVDFGGCPNLLLGGDTTSPKTAPKATTLIEVKKIRR